MGAVSIAITSREHAEPDSNLLNVAVVARWGASRHRSLLWRIRNFAALSCCRSYSAEFVEYDSLVGLKLSLTGWLGSFQFRCPTMPYRKYGKRMGDEGKAVGIAQAPAALLSCSITRDTRRVSVAMRRACFSDRVVGRLSRRFRRG